MTTPLAITAFDFEAAPADQDALIRAWMPEIEEAARSHVPMAARTKRATGFCCAAMSTAYSTQDMSR